jgi:hypothetical protein
VTPAPNGPQTAPTRPVPPRPALEVRIAALQAAATFAGGKALSTEVSTTDVLKVAAAFEHWLLEAR